MSPLPWSRIAKLRAAMSPLPWSRIAKLRAAMSPLHRFRIAKLRAAMSPLHSSRVACVVAILTVVAFLPAVAQAQETPLLESPLPLDPQVRTGMLDNGLRYYVRRNTEPEDRAELYLAVDAGSILENDDQLGLAHFVEHMLFNGTRRYPNEELIDFLESTGMRFGPDVNAYTSFDETVYTLTIPTDSTRIVEQAFDVLEDWAGYATLSDTMIDQERGVVVEEWRARDENAQGRIREKILPVVLHGSRYKDRLPIGTPDVIREASYETIRSFYNTWYRPDLMAVIAVGDFDPDHFESLIREHFSSLEAPADPMNRPAFDVPGHDSTLYSVVTDPEYPVASITVYYKRAAENFETVENYRDRLIGSLFNQMLNARLAEIARRGNAPFLGAQAFKGAFVRPAEFYGLSAQTDEDSLLVGLHAVLTEATRAREHGFTETELARQKQEMLRTYQQSYNEREKTNSAAFAREYVSHFLEQEPAPGITFEFEAVQQLLPGIAVDEVNALAEDLLASENRAVIVVMPEKDELVPPTEDELASVIESIQEASVDAYVDDVQDRPLIDETLDAAEVISTATVTEIGVTVVELANGVRVVMKPTDFKEDEVKFTAFSPGGSSLLSDHEAFEAETSTSIVTRSGVADFDRTQLEKMLAGKIVSVSPYVSETEEGFNGSASPEDLETLFQLIHLYFTAPRTDQDAIESYQNQMRSSLENRAANPMAVFNDSLIAALYDNHIRRIPPTIQMVESIDSDDVKTYYADRFADAGDFTFVFAGSFDVDRLTELAGTYLGSLPAVDRDETWRDVAPDLPEGVVETTVHKGVGQQSWVAMVFSGPFEYDREHRHQIRSLADVLTILLRRDLREDRGGVYGVSINPSTSDRPDETYTMFIYFSCDPERVDELTEAVFAQIETLKTEGPPDDVISTVREQQRRERETDLRTNDFWVSVLDFYYSRDEDVLDVLRYDELIQSLTAEEIQEAAQRYLDQDRLVKGILYPEGFGSR